MKKIKSLSEGQFLKLFFTFFSAAFLLAAFFMPDRGTMLSGLWQILSQPSKLTCSYFAIGGYAATFLNMGLVGILSLLLFVVFKGTPNNASTLAFILTLGFGSWGINILNIWPTVFGVMLYGLVKKEKFGTLVNAMLFSTGIAPLITDLMIRYPHAEVVGFNLPGIGLSLLVGAVIGFFLPAGLANSPKVHKGFDLYSAALPIGMTAFFLNATLFKTLGVDLPAGAEAAQLQVASQATVNVFCLILFGACVAFAFALGCRPKDYWQLLKDPALVTNFSSTYGNATFLMNVASSACSFWATTMPSALPSTASPSASSSVCSPPAIPAPIPAMSGPLCWATWWLPLSAAGCLSWPAAPSPWPSMPRPSAWACATPTA